MELGLQVLDPWYWWALAAVLVILEVVTPGVFFLWIGLAAAEIGALVYVWPAADWRVILLLFALLAVSNAVAAWLITQRFPIATDRPNLNKRGQQYVGRHFTLNEAVVNGHGVLRVDDTTWRIIGADCPAGTSIQVTGVDGTALRIAPLA
jgi:membrane protein implicated in regulation of membrane protease activity